MNGALCLKLAWMCVGEMETEGLVRGSGLQNSHCCSVLFLSASLPSSLPGNASDIEYLSGGVNQFLSMHTPEECKMLVSYERMIVLPQNRGRQHGKNRSWPLGWGSLHQNSLLQLSIVNSFPDVSFSPLLLCLCFLTYLGEYVFPFLLFSIAVSPDNVHIARKP